MALIACFECGADVSDKAPTCPRCGVPLLVESKLIVAAPTQAMLISPKVSVVWGDREVARLRRGEVVEIPIEADGKAWFEAGIRYAEVLVKSGRVTRVQLGWDRISGKLVAQQVEAITSGSSLL